MKILCTADIHIGRRSSRVSDEESNSSHSARNAWTRIIDAALEQDVDLVAVAGDVINEGADYYEAFGVLEQGLKRLSREGIPVVMIAGNHDHDSLRRFSLQFKDENTHFLGMEGWEKKKLTLRNGEQLHVVGWSFPAARAENPFASGFPEIPNDGLPVLGLIHGDVDQSRSIYAPCRLDDFRTHGDILWLIGHVHGYRELLPGPLPLAFYPGSPQALDPGEQGNHGARLIDWPQGSSPLPSTPLPISSVIYETLEVDLDGAVDEHEAEGRMHRAISVKIQQTRSSSPHLERMVCRLRFTGKSPLHPELVLGRAVFLENITKHETSEEGIVISIDGTPEIQTTSPLDLAATAAGNGALAVLARFILELESGGAMSPENKAFLESVSKELGEVFSRMHLPADGREEMEGQPRQIPPDAREVLLAQAKILFEVLHSQKS